MNGVSKRSAFIIDKNGIIRYKEILDDAGSLPNFDKLKEVLKSL
jgi:peroxiredoxin